MKLLLARHGNTFEAGETPYIVGRNEDLALTSEGETQAVHLAELLRIENLIPTTICSGELRRTRRMADIVSNALALSPPIEDTRLTELDYGAWSGLTTNEVRARFGTTEAEAWDHNGIIPEGRNWYPSLDKLTADTQDFASEALQRGGMTLAVTSNGVLRFFAKLVDGLFEELASSQQLKVGTGNLCCLEHDGAGWQLGFWNRKP